MVADTVDEAGERVRGEVSLGGGECAENVRWRLGCRACVNEPAGCRLLSDFDEGNEGGILWHEVRTLPPAKPKVGLLGGEEP